MKIRHQNLRKNVTITGITFLLIFAIGNKLNAQEDKKDALFNMWHLNTYVIEGKKYAPEKKEKNDFILFKKDMTFVSKSEGKDEEGTFIRNTNGGYVEMIDKNGEKLKAYIISVTKKTLVLKFDIEEIKDVEVHYNIHL